MRFCKYCEIELNFFEWGHCYYCGRAKKEVEGEREEKRFNRCIKERYKYFKKPNKRG